MADKQSHTVRNGIVATVVGGLILTAILTLRSFFVEALLWGWAGVIWVWGALISHYSLPVWLLLIVGFLAFVGVVRLFAPYFVIQNRDKPSFLNYTQDMLYGARWRWSWTGTSISNLWCFCPTCDAQLVPFKGLLNETHLVCERCPPEQSGPHFGSFGRVVTTRPGDRDYLVGAVEREILRRIRTNEDVATNR